MKLSVAVVFGPEAEPEDHVVDPNFSRAFRHRLGNARGLREYRILVPVLMATIGRDAAQTREAPKFVQEVVFASRINGLLAFSAHRRVTIAGRVLVCNHFLFSSKRKSAGQIHCAYLVYIGVNEGKLEEPVIYLFQIASAGGQF